MTSRTYNIRIKLGGGTSIADMIASDESRIPDSVSLYAGDDAGNIPAYLVGCAEDLVVHIDKCEYVVSATVRYYDPVTGSWVGDIAPRALAIGDDAEWFSWRWFGATVMPFKAQISIIYTSTVEEEEGGSSSGGSSSSSSSASGSHEECKEDIEELTQKFDQMSADVADVRDDMQRVISGLMAGGVGYSVIESDK